MKKFSLLLALVSLQAALGATIALGPHDDLQAALNAARPGDTITLAAGASYVGNYTLAANPGPEPITIQSSAMSALPAEGNRVSPRDALNMPKLVSPNNGTVLYILRNANHYRVIGIEMFPAPGNYVDDIVKVGDARETSVEDLPYDVVLDRDYIHGSRDIGSKRGIALNGRQTIIKNCYLRGFWSTWQDTQAIVGWNGPGPYQIINNYLEAGSETVGFGGDTTWIKGVVPSDILIQRNYFHKPWSWWDGSSSYAGKRIWVKNHIELKAGRRVTIDSNIFDNVWVGANQRGFAIQFTVRTFSNTNPHSVVSDVTVTNNIIRHAGGGINFSGHDDDGTGSAGNFIVRNNLFEDISRKYGDYGQLFQMLNDVNGIVIDHNTAFETGAVMSFDVAPSPNVNYTNNIAYEGMGVVGNSTSLGTGSFEAWAPGGDFAGNVIIGGPAAAYPSNDYFPSSVDEVDFVDPGAGNFQLASDSPYIKAATDSTQIGADVAAINAATANVISGQQNPSAGQMPSWPSWR